MTLLRFIWSFLSGIVRLVFSLIRIFGLIVPLCYLAVAFGLNLAFPGAIAQSVAYTTLFYVGLGLSIFFAFAVFVRNVTKKHTRYDLAAWEKELAAREKSLAEREKAISEAAQANQPPYFVPVTAIYPPSPTAGYPPNPTATYAPNPTAYPVNHAATYASGLNPSVYAAPSPHPSAAAPVYPPNPAASPMDSAPSAPNPATSSFDSAPSAPNPATSSFDSAPSAPNPSASADTKPQQPDPVQDVYPKIYRVKEDPSYVLYEYRDRFEVFREDKKQRLHYVRTDVKTEM